MAANQIQLYGYIPEDTDLGYHRIMNILETEKPDVITLDAYRREINNPDEVMIEKVAAYGKAFLDIGMDPNEAIECIRNATPETFQIHAIKDYLKSNEASLCLVDKPKDSEANIINHMQNVLMKGQSFGKEYFAREAGQLLQKVEKDYMNIQDIFEGNGNPSLASTYQGRLIFMDPILSGSDHQAKAIMSAAEGIDGKLIHFGDAVSLLEIEGMENTVYGQLKHLGATRNTIASYDN